MILINSAVRTRQRTALAREPFFKRSSSLDGTMSGAAWDSCLASKGRIEFSAAEVSRKSQSRAAVAIFRISSAVCGPVLVRAQDTRSRFSGQPRSPVERVINDLSRELRGDSTITGDGIAGGFPAERRF